MDAQARPSQRLPNITTAIISATTITYHYNSHYYQPPLLLLLLLILVSLQLLLQWRERERRRRLNTRTDLQSVRLSNRVCPQKDESAHTGLQPIRLISPFGPEAG